MNVILVNKSNWSDESLQAIVDFLAPCYGNVKPAVRLTVRSRPRNCGVWGKAYIPSIRERRTIRPGEFAVTIFIGGKSRESIPGVKQYPFTAVYKKTAGGAEYRNVVEEFTHTLAHELRHVEQFEACRVRYSLTPNQMFLFVPDPTSGRTTTFGSLWRKWERSIRAGYRHGSSEVDAELVAHGLLAAYKTCLENNLLGKVA